MKNKKFMFILMFMFVLVFGSVYALSGDGTEISPYLINNCDDFDLLNQNEDFSSFVYIKLVSNIDCSNYVGNYLINKTILNGINFNGQNYEIFNYTKLRVMSNINVNSGSIIQNIKFNHCNHFGFFNNVVFDESHTELNFINYTHDNSTSTKSGYSAGYFMMNIQSNTNSSFNLYRVFVNISSTSINENGVPYYSLSGTNDGLNLNWTKFFYGWKQNSGSYESIFGSYGSSDVLNKIYGNEIQINQYGNAGKYVMLLSRQDTINEVILKNIIFGHNRTDVITRRISEFTTISDKLEMENVIILGGRGHPYNDTKFHANTNLPANIIYKNNIYHDILSFTGENWSRLSIGNIYSDNINIYENFSSDIWKFEDGQRPSLKWYTEEEEETPSYLINCLYLDYEITEFNPNFDLDVQCETNNYFKNYTLNGVENEISLNESLIISNSIENALNNSIYPLEVCINDGTCKDYNITITWKIDNIKPNCSTLPEISNLYKNETFNLSLNCSDRYTNLTFDFYTFPVSSFINTTYNVNETYFNDSLTFTSPTFDFTLYVNVSDSRDNNILLTKFYQSIEKIEESTTINQSFKSDSGNYDTPKTLMFIGVLFFILIMILIGMTFNIPIFAFLGGICYLFLGVLFIDYHLITGLIITIFGLIFTIISGLMLGE